VCVCVIVRILVHNTAQISSDYLYSYPSDKHQSSDAVYWRGGEGTSAQYLGPNCPSALMSRQFGPAIPVPKCLRTVMSVSHMNTQYRGYHP